MIGSLLQDIRYGFRMLLRTPGFSLVCVLTMALAIGANTAIFSAVNGVLLQPLRYHDPERLVVIGHRPDGGPGLNSTTPGNFYDWQRDATGFEAMAAWTGTERNISNGASAERVPGVLSAGSVFDVLGAPRVVRAHASPRLTTAPANRSSSFSATDCGSGSSATIAAAIGKALTLNASAHTIIGVMPPDFAFPSANVQFWVPARFDQAFRGNRVAILSARRGAFETRRQRRAGAGAARCRDGSHPCRIPARDCRIRGRGSMPMQALLVDGVRTRLFTLMGAVACVLLIACANLGNLLLARAASRRREIALRQALGARPSRVFRQLLTESLILAILGGAVGIALGAGLLRSLLVLLSENLPRASEVRLDATVLAFTLLAARVFSWCGVCAGAEQVDDRDPRATRRRR